jgi:ribonuclease HI
MMIVLKETIKKIESLERNKLPKPYNINVHSDSQFVIKGASEWLYGWKKRNWKNNTGEDVSYKEIWQELYKDYICNPDYNLNFIHVKGHTKNTDFKSLMNEKCDKLATDLVKQFKEENNLL